MSTETLRTDAAEVPLLERLDSIPMNGRAVLNSVFESRNIPYGNLCYLAAQEIRRLQVELSRVTAERDTLAKAFADRQKAEAEVAKVRIERCSELLDEERKITEAQKRNIDAMHARAETAEADLSRATEERDAALRRVGEVCKLNRIALNALKCAKNAICNPQSEHFVDEAIARLDAAEKGERR